jgi:hypothetical protein
MKIIILTLSENTIPLYIEFQKLQEETWDSIKVENVDNFYFFGGEKNEIVGNKIMTNFPSDIEHCLHRTLKCIELLNDNNIDYDFIFRTNSSSYVDKELLYDFVLNLPLNGVYGGHIGKYEGISYVSGSGILMSKDLCELLILNKNNLDYSYIDDATIGKFFQENGINILPISRINIHPNIIIDCLDESHFFEIPKNRILYRLKNNDRNFDLKSMINIYNIKYANKK